MKRLLAVIFVVAGVALFALGLLFFVGAKGQASRLGVAAVGLGAGAVLVGFGVRWFRAADADSPEQVLVELLDAARKANGELSELAIGAALGRRAPLAAPVLERLVAERLCERTSRDGGTWYLFKDLQPRLFVRRCEFCGAEMSIASRAVKCPRCGGAIGTGVAKRSPGGDGAYRMDE